MRGDDIGVATAPETGAADGPRGLRVVVSGGTRGIGAAVVRRFVGAGAQVVAIGRTGDGPDGAHLVVADLATADGVRAAADGALEHLGGLDVVVDNAGATEPEHDGPLATTDDHWLADLNVNLLAAVRLDRALVPRLTAQGRGAVIHVSSIAAVVAQPHIIAYTAAKAALEAYSAGLAKAVGPAGVRVNVVRPGVIETGGGLRGLRQSAEHAGVDPSAVRAGVEAGSALGRLGRAEEVADVVAHLASPRASYVTGAVVSVDGGLSLSV